MKVENNKFFGILKNAVFIFSGVAVILFYIIADMETAISGVPFIVGATMLLFGVDTILTVIVYKKKLNGHTKLFESIALFIMGIVVMFVGRNSLTIACVIWGVWSIQRECREIAEKVFDSKNKVVASLNLLESIVIICFSVILIFSPADHHAYLHLLILGIELILEVAFPLVDKTIYELSNKKSR